MDRFFLCSLYRRKNCIVHTSREGGSLRWDWISSSIGAFVSTHLGTQDWSGPIPVPASS